MREVFETKKEAREFNDKNNYDLHPHRNYTSPDEWVLSSHRGDCNCGMCPTLRENGYVN
jgi:hypothetical protein